jgi:nitrite reductase/ring-hydroxylating ferredoxin subunit
MEFAPTRSAPEQLSVPPDGRPYHDQPQWRNDFPIDWPQDEFVTRREFTKFLVLTSFAFLVGQIWILAKSLLGRRRPAAPETPIARLESIPVGGSFVFGYPAPHDRCVAFRTDESTLVAFSQKCTHLSCAVIPDAAGGLWRCPCHNGSFELTTGIPVAGPPRRPLERIQLDVRDGVVYAVGREVRA